VATAFGAAPSEAARLVRHVARKDAPPGGAPEPPRWCGVVSPGWSEGLEALADWTDTDVPDGIGHGIVSVLVARLTRRGKVSVTGYAVDGDGHRSGGSDLNCHPRVMRPKPSLASIMRSGHRNRRS